MLPARFLFRIVLVFSGLLLTTVACATGAVGEFNQVTIGEIMDPPFEFEGKSVLVMGIHSWKHVENAYDPPVTPTDWIIKDDTGWIYVTGENPSKKQVGHLFEVRGTVKVTQEGVPYIRAKSVTVQRYVNQ